MYVDPLSSRLPVQDSTREVVRSTVGVILNSQNLARIIWYLYDMYHVGNAVFVETVSPTVWGGESDTLWGVIYGSLETGPPAGSVDEASQKLRAFHCTSRST